MAHWPLRSSLCPNIGQITALSRPSDPGYGQRLFSALYITSVSGRLSCAKGTITQALHEMIKNGHSTLEVRSDVHDGYTSWWTRSAAMWSGPIPGRRAGTRTATTASRSLRRGSGSTTGKLTQHFVPEEYRAGHTPMIPGQEARAVSSVDHLTVG